MQQNPAFLTLRRIEVCTPLHVILPLAVQAAGSSNQLDDTLDAQAAREIASTISAANNRVFLSADSLLLNLVRLL